MHLSVNETQIWSKELLPESIAGVIRAFRTSDELNISTAGATSMQDGRTSKILAQSRVPIACGIKPVTALCVLLLCDEGRIQLDAPLGYYLSEFSACKAGREITVSDLLSHRTGLEGILLGSRKVRNEWSWADIVEHVKSRAMILPPGTAFSYMHTEYVILSVLLERVAGRSLEVIVEDLVLDQLSIDKKAFFEPPKGATVSGSRFDILSKTHVACADAPISALWKGSVSSWSISADEALNLLAATTCGASNPWRSRFVASACERVGLIPLCAKVGYSENMPVGHSLMWSLYGANIVGHNGLTMGQAAAYRGCLDRSFQAFVMVAPNVPAVRDSLLAECLGSPKGDYDSELPIDADVWAGEYVGLSGFRLVIETSGHELTLSVGPKSEGRIVPLRVVWSRDIDGVWKVSHFDAPVTIGFFIEPTSSARCIMFGLTVFRRKLDSM